MPSLESKFSRFFNGNPSQKYPCPTCEEGRLIPDIDSFREVEPTFSTRAHDHEAWDPDWIERRFSYRCICDNENCAEVAFVSGRGGVDQAYDFEGGAEYYDFRSIQSFFPAPSIVPIPEAVPREVAVLLKKSFALYWVDVSAAANAMRASLEALMDQLKIPRTQKTKKGKIAPLSLHGRLAHWSETQKEYAELCFALKEVGNLGSHGETVREKHYFGALEIYAHVLSQLFENDAARMKELAEKIRSDIKGRPAG